MRGSPSPGRAGASAVVLGEPDRLARAIDNILDNAMSASRRRAGWSRSPPRASATRSASASTTKAPAFPTKRVKRSLTASTQYRPEGEDFGRHSGLGLAIARAIVEGHDGEIDVQDRDDAPSGARFTIRLPAADRHDMSKPQSRLSSETLHASTVAIDGRAVLIPGPSGSGKSDLALRLLDRGFTLVSDDQTIVRRDGERLIASAPPTIAGKLEIRGVGIVDDGPCRRRSGRRCWSS